MEALDQFYPDRMANRILGMGDVLSLVERAQQAFDEDEAARLNKKIRQNNFSFEDFYSQLQQIKRWEILKISWVWFRNGSSRERCGYFE